VVEDRGRGDAEDDLCHKTQQLSKGDGKPHDAGPNIRNPSLWRGKWKYLTIQPLRCGECQHDPRIETY
jgi:hypothetical protein